MSINQLQASNPVQFDSIPNQTNFTYFGKDIQVLLNLLVFFIIWPALNVAGNSITFYFFLFLIVKIGAFWTKPGLGKNLFLIFGLITILSALFAPYQVMPRYLGMVSTFIISIQWIYWLLTSVFIIVYRNKINYIELAKWVFWGTVAATIGFYLIKYKVNLGPIEVKTNLSRNSFVFTLLASIPVSIYYIVNIGKKHQAPFYMFGFLIVMLLTNGRSGGVIILVELLLISAILYRGFQQIAKILFIALGLLFFLNESNILEPIKGAIADNVESLNPRFAALIRGEEGDKDGDLSYDKSWLLRVLMVAKGQEILESYPLLGIGPNNFAYYDARLAELEKIERLSSQDVTFLNSRSSHNSYVQISSEFGYSGLILVLVILFIPVIIFIRKFFTSRLETHDLFLISILGAAMHFYAINTITGAIAWLFIGLAWVCISFQNIKWLKL